MANKPLLTCAVSAYNAEKTLARTLGSLCCPPLADQQEILVIDDGSTDATGAICEKFAALNYRIRVLSQPNQGLGKARNRALDEARGAFITFCDADDIFLAENQVALAQRAQAYGADLVCATGFALEGNKTMKDFWDSAIVRRLSNCGDEKVFQSMKYLLQPSACNKLYSLDYTRAKGIRFSEGTLFEDVEFTSLSLLHTTRILAEDVPVFIYDFHQTNSITASRTTRRFEVFPNAMKVLEAIRAQQPDGLATLALCTALMRTVLWCFDNVPDGFKAEFNEMTSLLFQSVTVRPDADAIRFFSPLLTDFWDKRALLALLTLWEHTVSLQQGAKARQPA